MWCFRDLHMIILVFWFFSRHEYLISQILTFLYSMHFFQYTCKVKLLQRTSFHGYRLMIKSSNYKTLLIFPGSRIFSLFPEFQVIFDFLEFQKKAVCHPCICCEISEKVENIVEKMRENEILQHNKDNSIIFSSDIFLNV